MVAELEKINCDEAGGFIAEYISDTNNFWHFHPEYEIILNTKKNGTRIVGDSVELFDNYDLVLIGSNIPHCWNYYSSNFNDAEKNGILLHFKLTSLGESLLSQHELTSIRQLLIDSERGILFSESDARKAESIMLNMLASKGIDKMIGFFQLMKIMCSSEKRTLLCSEGYRRAFDERGNKKMNEVYNYLQENYAKPLTLENVSRIVHMSPFAFSRYFKKNCGTGFIEYLNKIRMTKACHLLRETDYAINRLAVDSGFSSISNFNKQFRKAEGISPRAYRIQFK